MFIKILTPTKENGTVHFMLFHPSAKFYTRKKILVGQGRPNDEYRIKYVKETSLLLLLSVHF